MPVEKHAPLTDEERARRLRELAEAAGTSDDPEAFDRAFDRAVKCKPQGEPDKPAGPRTNDG